MAVSCHSGQAVAEGLVVDELPVAVLVVEGVDGSRSAGEPGGAAGGRRGRVGARDEGGLAARDLCHVLQRVLGCYRNVSPGEGRVGEGGDGDGATASTTRDTQDH